MQIGDLGKRGESAGKAPAARRYKPSEQYLAVFRSLIEGGILPFFRQNYMAVSCGIFRLAGLVEELGCLRLGGDKTNNRLNEAFIKNLADAAGTLLEIWAQVDAEINKAIDRQKELSDSISKCADALCRAGKTPAGPGCSGSDDMERSILDALRSIDGALKMLIVILKI